MINEEKLQYGGLLQGLLVVSLDPWRFPPEAEGLDHSRLGGGHLAEGNQQDQGKHEPRPPQVEFSQGTITTAAPTSGLSFGCRKRRGVENLSPSMAFLFQTHRLL